MKVHLISHTHWDREWFITHEYTDEWLVILFNKLLQLIENNGDYRFVLDGQTLLLEDLIRLRPDLENKVKEYVKSGNLLIGPHYCQIDWRIASESAILMNFIIGEKDSEKFGGRMKIGWLLDNFGHISQTTQLHKLFDLEGVFVWRGYGYEPKMEFIWESADGSKLPAIFLIGGYRNIYGLSHTPDIAFHRVKHEVEKLSRFSITGNIPLLDGYDLDLEPEDPMEFIDVESKEYEFLRSDPERFMDHIKNEMRILDTVKGELLSGKYACVFPGTLSTRNYLKIESDLVSDLLGRYLSIVLGVLKVFGGLDEPDLVEYESMWRDHLKTLAHDNICGVGVDQIHDGMENTYRGIYTKAKNMLERHLSKLLGILGFRRGIYMLNISPHKYDLYYPFNGKRIFRIRTHGTGIFKAEEIQVKFHETSNTRWSNDYYEFEIDEDQNFVLNGGKFGFLVLEREEGDAYSSFTKPLNWETSIDQIQLSRSEHALLVKMKRRLHCEDADILLDERITLDQTPIIRWKLNVKSKGNSYKLRIGISGIDTTSNVHVGMPFDVVERSRVYENTLDEEKREDLMKVLLAAREVGSVDEFPFQGFIFFKSGKRLRGIVAKGLREYKVDEDGKILVTLIRSVDWITKNVPNRTGDAGPMMYVPSAKCERRMSFEIGFFDFHPLRWEDFLRWYHLFSMEPLIFEYESELEDGREEFPIFGDGILWSYINPFVDPPEIFHFDHRTRRIDRRKLVLKNSPDLVNLSHTSGYGLRFLNFPEFPVGEDESTLDEKEIERMRNLISEFQSEVDALERNLNDLEGLEYHRNKHRSLSLSRTILEMKLSILLNEIRYGLRELKYEELRDLVFELNKMRSKRRIYDYILEYQLFREAR